MIEIPLSTGINLLNIVESIHRDSRLLEKSIGRDVPEMDCYKRMNFAEGHSVNQSFKICKEGDIWSKSNSIPSSPPR